MRFFIAFIIILSSPNLSPWGLGIALWLFAWDIVDSLDEARKKTDRKMEDILRKLREMENKL